MIFAMYSQDLLIWFFRSGSGKKVVVWRHSSDTEVR